MPPQAADLGLPRTPAHRPVARATGATALLMLLIAHTTLSHLRFHPKLARLIDPPLRVLVRDGSIDHRNLKRCGLTDADLAAALRQHGLCDASSVRLAIYEAKGAVSVLIDPSPRTGPGVRRHFSKASRARVTATS